MTPVPKKADHVWRDAAIWLGKKLGSAALIGVTAAYTFWSTWTGLQTTVAAHDAMLLKHGKQIEAIEQARTAEAVKKAGEDATTDAERKAIREKLAELEADMKFMQRELIGRERR